MYLKMLTDQLSISISPVPVYEDNQNVINWIREKALRSRTRHLGAQLNFVREAEESQLINLIWIPGSKKVADAFTKPLNKELFMKFKTIMNCNKCK
mmetsp:Transcript_17711/g.23342  ORF Transcript_17711/g.23342 Transcript_17711/m.23342 type:complete len:96 (-) Transcript_17711:163-450(-)